MLTGNEEAIPTTRAVPHRLAKMMRVEWLGQTIASLCWICSVFAYGVSSTGDWLQLCAATAWFIANIASVTSEEST